MSDQAQWRCQLELIREQIWHGYLTSEGLKASHDTLVRFRDQMPDGLKPDADWLIVQLAGELFMRDIDSTNGQVNS